MKNVAPRIGGAGICCMDYIVVSPQAKWGDMVLVDDYIVQGGGLVATGLVACARLGADCDFLSLLGDDQVGDQIAAELQDENIPSDSIVRFKDGKSPFSFIHVDSDNGERTIFHRSGAGLDFKEDLAKLDKVDEWGAVLVDDIYPDLATVTAKAARAKGVPVVADMMPNEKNAVIMPWVDVLIAPRHYARQLGLLDNLDAALNAIHKLGPTTAVITLGSEGYVYSDPTGRGRGNAFKVNVVDTTGAGDTFHGAFTYGLARKWDTARCAEFASAVAAIKCTKAGGRTGLPSFAQTIEFLQKNGALDWVAIP